MTAILPGNMGQHNAKQGNGAIQAVASTEVVDISKEVTDSADDINDREYRIVITCKGDNRLPKNTMVTAEITGDQNRHLLVIASNKKYYNSLLPKAASKCEHKIVKKDKVDLLHLTITKAEEGYWTSKKK